jgi:protein-S-isoprenylcysteine O-methyltransferase Ste14
VTDGVFARSRHPMYLGMVFILAGVALGLGSAGAVLVVPTFALWIRRRFVLPEEAHLEAQFGRRYRDYARRVRRWL